MVPAVIKGRPGLIGAKGGGRLVFRRYIERPGCLSTDNLRFLADKEFLVFRLVNKHDQKQDEHGHHQVGPGDCPMCGFRRGRLKDEIIDLKDRELAPVVCRWWAEFGAVFGQEQTDP